MRVGVPVLASTFIFATTAVTLAQNLGDIINQLPAIAQSGIAKLSEAEWKKLPQTELDCLNQKLRERGDSVQSLARRGVLPFDSRAAEIRSQCRPSSAAASFEQSPAQIKYAVDGLALGSRVKPDSAAYREYKRANNLMALCGARRHATRRRDVVLLPQRIRLFIHRTEALFTSIVLKSLHFLVGTKSIRIYSNIHTRSGSRLG